VAELAVLIGQEMGLPQQRLRGLYLSGVVHDLGKIEVPAEILSKPSRLHPVEFALVKRHPEVGYNILKNIDFPGQLPTSSASTTNTWMAPAIRWACPGQPSCWSHASSPWPTLSNPCHPTAPTGRHWASTRPLPRFS
jgi:hypothetical protein